jgi:histidinol-phosphate aminotransferase
MTSQFGPSYVRAIAPYIAGKPISEVAREFGLNEASIVKLASNENPLGMPESAKRAMTLAIDELGRYPDSNGFELKAALAERYGVPPEWITLGNGSNDILEMAAHAFVEKAQSIVYSQYSFAVYALATQGLGARAIVVPAVEYGHDIDAMLAAIADDTRLVFVANPNNPTGTFIDGPALEAFIAKVPRHVAIVLDEAYTEYLPAGKRYDSIDWVRRYPNLLVSRTFSKAFGLAGLRIGFAIAQPELTDLLNRLRQPFNVNSLAQAAAVAALNDRAFLARLPAADRSLRQVGARIRAVVRQFRDGARRRRRWRRRARESRLAETGRDRAAGRQLWFAAVAARHGRAAGGERSLYRRARAVARVRLNPRAARRASVKVPWLRSLSTNWLCSASA